jgi:hypothetical protein
MRTIGRASIASIINFFVTGAGIFAAFAAFISLCVLFAVPWVRLPIIVAAPVSFTMETPDQTLGGRANWGFEFREARRRPAPRTPGIDRIEGSVRIPSSSRWFIAANGLALIGVLMLVAAVLVALRDVLRTLTREKKPFVPANARRLRFIGWAVVAGELARTSVVYAENTYARAHLAIPGVTFDAWPQPHGWTILFGLLILVIAEVFRAGTELDEDQSLTI